MHDSAWKVGEENHLSKQKLVSPEQEAAQVAKAVGGAGIRTTLNIAHKVERLHAKLMCGETEMRKLECCLQSTP